jgi:hypothetical protein
MANSRSENRPESAENQDSAKTSIFDTITAKLRIVDRLLGRFKSEMSNDAKLVPIIQKFDLFKKELSWFGFAISTIQFAMLMYMFTYHSVTRKEENKLKLGVQLGVMAVSIPLAVMGILATFGVLTAAAPYLVITSAVKSISEKIWDMGVSLYERFTGKGREDQKTINKLKTDLKNDIAKGKPVDPDSLAQLTTLINNQSNRNGEIAKSTHALAMNVIASAGSILLLTPLMPIGAAILAGISAYGILDAIGYNPFAMAAKGINFLSNKLFGRQLINVNPFASKTEAQVQLDLIKEVNKGKSAQVKMTNTIAQISPIVRQLASTTMMRKAYAKRAQSSTATQTNQPKPQQTSVVIRDTQQLPVTNDSYLSDFSFFSHNEKLKADTMHHPVPSVIMASPAA